jgi:nitrate reductase NapAB chaperone NapD
VTLSGVVVACRPEDVDGVIAAVNAFGWAEVHQTDGRGRLVVTIEARDIEESMDRLTALQALPRVLSAELAQFYVGEHE